jgi:hypothetical protein
VIDARRKRERIRTACGAAAILLGLASAAASEPAAQLGPFAVGMTMDEARRAVPDAKWKENTDEETGRVFSLSASAAWTFDDAAYHAILRPDRYGVWSLELESDEIAGDLKACRAHMTNLIALLEKPFGRLAGPPGSEPVSTGVNVQRINGYPVVVGQPTVGGKETFSAGEDSHFIVEEEEGDRSIWYAETRGTRLAHPNLASVKGRFNAATPSGCRFEISLERQRGSIAANLRETLSVPFEPVFAAEFPAAEQDAARKAWRDRANAVFASIDDNIYPIPDAAAFKDNALAALREKRAAEPTASLNDLVDAALAGSRQPKGSGITLMPLRPKPKEGAPAGAPQVEQKAASVALRMINGVAALKLAEFRDRTSTEVADALKDARGRIVIDLRGNGGGLFDEIVQAASLFLGPGKLIAAVRDRKDTNEYKSPARPMADPRTDLEVIVLIDAKTDSGAIVFAAALADHGRARIVGVAAPQISGLMFTAQPMLRISAPNEPVFAKYPTGVIFRPNGAPVADGIKIDRPVKAEGDAAIAEAAKALAKP